MEGIIDIDVSMDINLVNYDICCEEGCRCWLLFHPHLLLYQQLWLNHYVIFRGRAPHITDKTQFNVVLGREPPYPAEEFNMEGFLIKMLCFGVDRFHRTHNHQ